MKTRRVRITATQKVYYDQVIEVDDYDLKHWNKQEIANMKIDTMNVQTADEVELWSWEETPQTEND